MGKQAPAFRWEHTGAGPVCRRVLATLPTWFGIPESVEDYVAVADRSPTVVASSGGEEIGLATVVRHSEHSAEIYVMGVVPAWHRRGVGRQMLEMVENELARDGVEFLQVKTLSPSHPDAGYQKTRAFYQAYGFRVLEEMPNLWGPANPALLLVKVVGRP